MIIIGYKGLFIAGERIPHHKLNHCFLGSIMIDKGKLNARIERRTQGGGLVSFPLSGPVK